jgi:CubicO group peptidase (beta-lactamase class C family)
MKRLVLILRIVMPLVALTCMVVFVPWNGAWAWLKPLPDTVQEQVEDAVGHGLDGIIVYVGRGGEESALYAAGWKDHAGQVPADAQALFKIASISKLYIATAAAKLVHSQALSLDDTLAELLPELAGKVENADRITLRMLLQHRSGIPNFTDHGEFAWSVAQMDPNEQLRLAVSLPAEFEPGAGQRYSNTNYLLIGAILDNTLGYDHQRYIREEILAPLGLTHTYGLLSQVDSAEVVSGYQHQYDGDLMGLDYVTPGGSMVATAEDVGVFLRALNDGSLLNEEEQAIYSSIYDYEHTGWLPGYQSIARYHRDLDAVVVQLVNSTGGEAEMVAHIVYGRIVRILGRE